jgi:integral membrane protein
MQNSAPAPAASQLEKRFVRMAHIEGVSYLILLFVAMPLKYFAGIPEVVKYTGWAHGVLFVAFCAFLPFLLWSAKWKFLRVVRAFILSLIPFGTFTKL